MGVRAFGNLHEQSIIFLVALWAHALFMDVQTAATLGWAYLGFRLLYPVIWTIFSGFTMKILWVTMPMYGIIIWLLGTTVAKVSYGIDLKTTYARGNDWIGVGLSVGAFFALFLLNAHVIGVVVQGFFPEKVSSSTREKGA